VFGARGGLRESREEIVAQLKATTDKVERLRLHAALRALKEKETDGASIWDDPPSRFFHIIADVAGTPDRHRAVGAMPLLLVVAYAEKFYKELADRHALTEAAFKAGSPMAAFAGMFSGRRKR
jgi:hypothetical protein